MSRQIEFWYGRSQSFGARGRPQRWINILGTVDPDGLRELTCRLPGGSTRALSVGPDNLRLRAPGDFNAEILYDEIPEGQSVVEFRAEYGDGSVIEDRVTVDIVSRSEAPLPYEVAWGELGSVSDAVQIVDGKWDLTSAGARPRHPHYDRLLALGDLEWTDYEAEVPVTIHGFSSLPGDRAPRGGFGVLFRWSGHVPDEHQPSREWRPNGAIAWYRARWDETPRTGRNLNISDAVLKDESLVKTDPLELELERHYVFRFSVRSRPGGTGEYRFRAWPADDPGHHLCDLMTHAREGEAPKGSILLIALWVDVTIGNIRVIRL